MTPVISFAFLDLRQGLVTCGRGVAPGVPEAYTHPCGFNDMMDFINNLIHFVLFFLALPIAAIMVAYAGFLLVTAGEESGHARQKAKNIFTHAVVGLVIAIASWLIIRSVLSIVGYDGAWIGLPKTNVF